MAPKSYKAAVGVRGDCLYCPLSLSIDSYWNCLADCHHCYFRRLNRTWGQDLRPADPVAVRKQLQNGLKNPNPRSTLAWALHHKKTLRLGNHSDPYQDAEKEHRVTRGILKALIELGWTFVIQSRFLSNILLDRDLLEESHQRGLLHILPVISPGAEEDQEVLERGRTTPIPRRLRIIKRWIQKGYKVGVNGEPFIPGYHTPEQFRDILRRLREVGVRSYNTYNLHANDLVFKRFHSLGLDIEKIWRHNQDDKWRSLLQQLLAIAEEEGMVLGCPDFVNSGWDWEEKANTCCGIDVPNPSRFNTHIWKRILQDLDRPSKASILKDTWEGIGDLEEGRLVLRGGSQDFYTMKDVK